MAVDFGVSQIIVVVEDGEQRRQEERGARRCMLLIDTNEAARAGRGTAEGDAEAKGYEVFQGEVTSAASCGAGSRSCGSR